jgi:hypothetical protein
MGFWGWIFGFVGFLSFSFTSRGTLNNHTALSWGLVFLVFYTVWVAGMLLA